ncbi:D-alanyl-D-alanine endopeptidase [Parvibium lacunae]|uniref:D-alanyl-D-alanine endopeptidase n=2 Tax=Parvibium lacunae TaxID=1888893 RepID=A0A368L8M4_9BURK|nr:D-alanyl-D-alanine endopeptidase [Parvibium lacunae]
MLGGFVDSAVAATSAGATSKVTKQRASSTKNAGANVSSRSQVGMPTRYSKVASSNRARPAALARTKSQKSRLGLKNAGRAPMQMARPSQGMKAGLHLTEDPLALKASVALVQDLATSDVVFAKNSDAVLPIASITKLMTALVITDAMLPMDEWLEISDEDVDYQKGSHSRLPVGTRLTRADTLHIALMASENRAAHALGRTYPGGLQRFVAAMNAKAELLGMRNTRFVDPTGLNSANVSSAGDLARLVTAAYTQPLIRQYSTDTEYWIDTGTKSLRYRNTNALVMNPDWQISLSKTGYIAEAGRCLVMHANIHDRSFVIVLLDSLGKYTRLGDAGRIKQWLEASLARLR